LITAKLSKISIASIMWFDLIIAIIGFVIALYIGYRQFQARAAQKRSAQPPQPDGSARILWIPT
jgi:hypothetical protein